MRGTVAKRLRREAERLSVGMPKVAYHAQRSAIRLRQFCTRGVYRTLKSQYKGKLDTPDGTADAPDRA